MRIGVKCMLILLGVSINLYCIDVETILKKADEKYMAKTQLVYSTMVVHSRRGKRTFKLKTYSYKNTKSFSEYLAPPREKGIKMLKINNDLWTYTPMADRIIKISGHLLKQSMMGSDLSYEDMLERDLLTDKYDAKLLKNQTINDRLCYVIELTAKNDNVAYYRREVWVDTEHFIALKEARYGKSGVLLKTTDVKSVFKVNELWYPKKIVFKDALKRGKGTEYIIDSLKMNIKIPKGVFSKASLRR